MSKSDDESVKDVNSEVDCEYQDQIESERQKEKDRRERRDHKSQVKREKRKRQKQRRHENRLKDGSETSRKQKVSSLSSSSESDSGHTVLLKKKKKQDPELLSAIKKIQKELKEGKEIAGMTDRQRGYNMYYEGKKPTEVEIEAYNLTKVHASDPMASLINK